MEEQRSGEEQQTVKGSKEKEQKERERERRRIERTSFFHSCQSLRLCSSPPLHQPQGNLQHKTQVGMMN